MDIDRRELLCIIAASVAAGPVAAEEHHHAAPTATEFDVATYQPRALSPAQYKTLDELAEMLIPAGDDGPGAHEAGVAYYLDTVLLYSDSSKRESWRRELDAAANGPSLESVMNRWAGSEASPQTSDELFFIAFKNAVIDAFYLSRAGRKSAGYTGDTALSSFAGCTHPEHLSA